MTGYDNTNELIEAWRTVFKNEMTAAGKAWVVFKHGTVVLIANVQSVDTVTEAAKKLMAQDGPVVVGTPLGDFNVLEVSSVEGLVVTGHCPVMFNIVLPSVMEDMSNHLVVGMTGRRMRDQDSKTCEVVHVQMPDA